MRLLVTGRHGQVAQAVLQLSGEQGMDVIALGRPEFDLERPEVLAEQLVASRPDVVVSAAAYTAVDLAESEPTRAHVINAVAPGVIAAAAAAAGAPIIHLSTDYVFDGAKSSPYVETDLTGPLTVYGATKLAGEDAVASMNPRHVILRTAWVYAPTGKNFVRTMLRLAETREDLGVVADQHGCPSYAPDIAAAVLRVACILARGEGEQGVYHMAGSESASWADFAVGILERSQARGGPCARVKPITTAEYPTPAPRPMNSRLDCSRMRRVFGVELAGWREALDRCLDALEIQSAEVKAS